MSPRDVTVAVTIEEAKAAKLQLEREIYNLIADFEACGLIVSSLAVIRISAAGRRQSQLAGLSVEVQL